VTNIKAIIEQASNLPVPEEPKRFVPNDTPYGLRYYVGFRIGQEPDLVTEDVVLAYIYGRICEGHYARAFDPHPEDCQWTDYYKGGSDDTE